MCPKQNLNIYKATEETKFNFSALLETSTQQMYLEAKKVFEWYVPLKGNIKRQQTWIISNTTITNNFVTVIIPYGLKNVM